MTHLEIREKFLKFFKARGHIEIPSASLLPTDPSVLFTTAGMQQFKPYYTGEAEPMKDFGSLNTVSIQKTLRTSDIDEVGDDSHLTFFEMLGNFSFGGYWKKEALQYGYDFIVKELGISLDRITVSVFKGDELTPADSESLELWRSLGFTDDKIIFGGREDNFWGPTGNKGPCGPTAEIYVDGVEVWNIVFNEFFCDEDKHFLPLTKRGIDTGMGFERLAAILQNKNNVFEIDLFVPLTEEIRGKNLYDYERNERPERIIADHLRASVFLIADGVMPSNLGQGYVLRRLLRRAIRYARLLNLPEDLYERAVHSIVHDIYGEVYPELKEKQKNILEIILAEKDKFVKTLDNGLKEFERLAKGKDIISGQDAFVLYTSFGFPLELVEELAKERKIKVDGSGFQKELKKHQEASRTASAGMFKGGLADTSAETTRLHTAAHLMLEALRRTLGGQIQQRGSNITPERLRFDFSHGEKMTPEQIKQVEEIVNEQIQKDLPVHFEEMSVDEAKKIGATGVFEHKYGDKVKVYFIGKEPDYFSKEICGGPHVTHTGEIIKFKITKEESASAGTRRIRAVVG